MTVVSMTTLTARSPEDLLAMVPVVLGFEPADSIVMLTLDARQTFHARVDLPPDKRGVPEVVDLLLGPAVRHRARSAVLLLYTADDDLARAVVRRFGRGAPGGRGPALVEALRVDGGCWFPLLRPPGDHAATGVPYDVSSHPFVVEAVWSGRVLHGSRTDLAATLRPDPDGVAELGAARDGEPGSAEWLAARLGEWVGGDGEPPADVAARLLVSLAVPQVRDVVPGHRSTGRPPATTSGSGRRWCGAHRRTSWPTPLPCWRCAPGWRATAPSRGVPSTVPARATRAMRWRAWWPTSWSPPSLRPTGS